MNPEPTLVVWLRTFVVLGAGVLVVTLLAALAAWPLRSAAGRRAVWQAVAIGLAVLVAAEVTGATSGLGLWLASDGATAPEFVEPGPPLDAPLPPLERALDGPRFAPAVEVPVTPGAGRADGPVVWWPGLLWLVGAVLVAGRASLARLLLVLFRRRQRAVTDPELLQRCQSVAERLGLRRPVRLLEADGLTGPVAFGVVWPTVALPAGFATDFTPVQQEAVLAHELGHLASCDPAWHLLSDLVTAALWWHPLAWEARHRLRAASEAAADEASVVVADGPGVLAGCLVQMGRRLTAARAGAWERMAGGEFRSGLGRRVKRLLSLDAGRWRSPGRVRLALILLVLPAFLLAGAFGATAWVPLEVLQEGEVPMSTLQHSWKRSLAAMALVAVLGAEPGAAPPAPPGPMGLPGMPGGEEGEPAGGGAPGEKKETPKETADRIKTLEVAREALSEQLKAMTEQSLSLRALRERLRRAEARPTPQSQKLEGEIKDLEKQVKALEAQLNDAEAKIQALKADLKKQQDGPRVKVFRLSHRDPVEVRDVLNRLLPRGVTGDMGEGSGGEPGGGMSPPMGSGPMGGGLRPPGGSGMGPPGFAGPGGGMPGMMGGPGMGMPSWRLAVDKRTNSLIVRGTARDIQTAGDFVAMLDVADGKAPPAMKNIRTFKLKFAAPDEVAKILEVLDLGALVAPVKKGNMLVVSGPEATLKDVAEVIAAVDVEGKPALRDPEK